MTDAGRVISGSAKGVRLLGPGEGTRPLADRVKQAIFGMLEPVLPDARVLDLFAGSGAGGIEALSRGAARATFVEKAPGAIRVIQENLARTRLVDRANVVRADVLGYLADRAPRDGPFDLVLVDPPYADVESMARSLSLLGADAACQTLAQEALVVTRYFWRHAPPETFGLLASVRTRRFGEAGVTIYGFAGGAGLAAAGGMDEQPEETAR